MTSIGYFKTLKSNGTESKSKKEWLSSQSSFEMGSSRQSDLKLNLPSASPNQASFEFCSKSNQVYIVHHGQPNTTFIGDKSLKKNEKVWIKSGDVISFQTISIKKSFKFEYSRNQENVHPNNFKKGRKSLAVYKSPKKVLSTRLCLSDRKTRSASKKLMDLESVKHSFKEEIEKKLFDTHNEKEVKKKKKEEETCTKKSVQETVAVKETEPVKQASPVKESKEETPQDDVSMEANLMEQIETVQDDASIDSIVMSTASLSDVSAPASIQENQQMNTVNESELPKEILVDTVVQEVAPLFDNLVEEASVEKSDAATEVKTNDSAPVSMPVEAPKSKASLASRYNKTSNYAKSYKNISQALRARAKTESVSKSCAEVTKIPYQKRAIQHMNVQEQQKEVESKAIESVEPFQDLTVTAKINRWKSSNPYVQISQGIRSMPNANERTQSLKQEEDMRNELCEREALKQERIAKEKALKKKKAAMEQKRLEKEENRRRHQEAVKKQAEKKAAMLKAQEEARLLLEKEQALEKERLRIEKEDQMQAEKERSFEREQERLRLEEAKRVEEARLKAEEEERLRVETEKAAEEERIRVESEQEANRLQALEEERLRMEVEAKERLRMEAEKKATEEERLRLEAARLQALEEERLRVEAEKKERLRIEAEEKAAEEERLRIEADRLQALEEERLRVEAEKKERLRIEAEEKAAEEERLRIEADRLQALEEERLRVEAEERERLRIEAEEKAAEEERLRLEAEKEVARLQEEKRLRVEAEEKEKLRIEAEKEAARLQEEERIRVEAEKAAEEEHLRLETEKEAAEKEKLRIEAKEEALQAEEEERLRVAEEEKERLRIEEEEEQERLRLENESESSMEEDSNGLDFSELSYQELRKECTARGLSSVGKKAVLIERLEESCINTVVEEEEPVEEEAEEDSNEESIDYASLKVAELRYLCDERSLEWKGLKKAELISLLESSEETVEIDEELIESESVEEEVTATVGDEEVEVEEDLSSFSYRELQQLCKERNLSAKGKKTELLARLQEN